MNMQPSKRDTERGKIKTRTRTSAPKRDLYSDAKSAFTSSR